MDLANLAPELAALLGIAPSTMLLIIIVVIKGANIAARLIPDDATGGLAVLRQICTIVGMQVSSRVTSGITVTDVAKAALDTPIPEKVADDINDALPIAKSVIKAVKKATK